MAKRASVLLMLSAAFILAGCAGYRPQAVFRDDVRTIYVAGFDNLTFRRGLEVPLTRAVIEEIKLRTPYVPAGREAADTVMTGELTDFAEGTLLKNEDDEILLNRVTATVRFRWRDRLTGAYILREQTVKESVRIAEAFEENQYNELFHRTAQRIVELMMEPW